MKKVLNSVIVALIVGLNLTTLVRPNIVQADSTVNLVANASAETSSTTDSTLPADWAASSWGLNTTKFMYAPSGHTGSRSLKVTTTNYLTGDAKWAFTPVLVTGGTEYIFRNYYKANVATTLVVAYDMTDGSRQYQTLATLDASSGWKHTGNGLIPPIGVSRMTVYHVLAANGILWIDDTSLAPAEQPIITDGVPNNSVEQTAELNSKQPIGWHSSSWGNNTAVFTYESAGHTGSDHSIKIAMDNYTDGDAKWYFDPQPVVPGQTYLVTDYYKSGGPTNLTAQVAMMDGSTKYVSLGTAPASIYFKQTRQSFVAPAGAAKVTVFHSLAANGTLQIDDMTMTPIPSAVITNGMPNSSIEQTDYVDPNQPLAWQHAGWGTNTTKYTYETTGHTGSRSLKITTTKYTNGDAKWFTASQPIIAGQAYDVSDYYTSTLPTSVIAQFTMQDGSLQYRQLPNAAAAASWTRYGARMYAPAGSASVAIWHVLSGVGSLQTDDYALTPVSSQPFSRGLVSLTFDDAWRSIYTNGFPILSAHHATSTQYILTGPVQSGDPDYMTLAMVKAFQDSGSEIGAHTVTHPDLTTVLATDLNYELITAKAYLETSGLGPILDFATPYGAYNDAVLAAIKPIYRSHRSTDVGFNTRDMLDQYNLKVQNITTQTTASDVAAWAQAASINHYWLIFVYHQVDTSGAAYSVTPNMLDAQLSAIDAVGLPYRTVDQALSEVVPQVAR